VDAAGETRVLCGVSTIACARIPEVNKGEPSAAEISDEERDAGSVEATKRQRVNQTDSVLDIGCSNESLISVAESSRQTLTTTSASRLPDLSNDRPVMADISNSKITKIMDKRLRPSEVQYECGLESI
jgi:hypothetical protein